MRAYLVACYFHRFYLQCSEVLIRAILAQSGQDQPAHRIEYELRRLVDEHGWSIFGLEEAKGIQRFLGVRIGAAHARVATEAWRRRPVPAFDVGEWVIQATLRAQAAAMDIGTLAIRLQEEKQPGARSFLARLTSLWNQAAKTGELETRSLCLLHATLVKEGVEDQYRIVKSGLEACMARKDGQSWLAALALIRESSSNFAEKEHLISDASLLSLIQNADFHLATGRAAKFLNLFRNRINVYDAIVSRFLEIALDNPQMYRLLSLLVATSPGNESVRERATDWIESNPNHPQAYHLLASLVAASPEDELVRKRATDWMESNLDHPWVFKLLEPLIAGNPGDGAVRKRATDWIEANQKHPQVFTVLAPLVAANPEDESIQTQATDWIESNPNHPQAYHLLASLVAASPEDELVRKRATDWMESNLDHPWVFKLLEPLIAGNPGDGAVRKRATDWIEANQKHPQVFTVLAPLVAASPGDESVRQRATDWIKSNPNHPQAYWLLAPLLAANPEDEEIRSRATGWIKSNFERPQATYLLSTLIARSNGAEDILQLGEAFVANPLRSGRDTIVGVLLTGSKAASKYIDLAFDCLGEENRRSRVHILRQLSKAAVNNLSLVLTYVAECKNETRKKMVLRSIAIGIQNRPQALEALLDGRINVLSLEDSNALIVRLLDEGVSGDELLRFVAVRLANGFHQRGYGFLLRAVKRSPAAREGILALPDLDSRVRAELSASGCG